MSNLNETTRAEEVAPKLKAIRRKRSPITPKASVAQKLIILQLQTRNQMLDPDGTIFKPQLLTPVPKITSWARCQIAAGLIDVIEQ